MEEIFRRSLRTVRALAAQRDATRKPQPKNLPQKNAKKRHELHEGSLIVNRRKQSGTLAPQTINSRGVLRAADIVYKVGPTIPPDKSPLHQSGRTTDFFWNPNLPHKCGVPRVPGTPHLCGSEDFCR